MAKLLPCRFEQRFGPFNMLTVHICSGTGIFRHLSNHPFFRLAINQVWGSAFCSKCRKFDVGFRNGEENAENILGFGDNCIWIGCVKHSLLPRENTCHRDPVCYQTVSRSQILLRKNVSNWSSFRYIKEYHKATAV